MWPSSLETGTGDFAFAAGHRRTDISLLAGTLYSASVSPTVIPAASSLVARLGFLRSALCGLHDFFACEQD
jgi:hypothetical protein